MSKATKRKHVFSELENFQRPQTNQRIVRVLTSRGNNLHEVEASDGSTFLVSMPTKFRKNVWVKRGDFVLVEPIEEGDKVKAEMVTVITPTCIRFLKTEKLWPVEFDNEDSSHDESELFENSNRPQCLRRDSSTEDSDST